MKLYANLVLDIDTPIEVSTSTQVIFPNSVLPILGEVTIHSGVLGCALIQGSPADLCRLAAALAEAAEKAKAANTRVPAVDPSMAALAPFPTGGNAA